MVDYTFDEARAIYAASTRWERVKNMSTPRRFTAIKGEVETVALTPSSAHAGGFRVDFVASDGSEYHGSLIFFDPKSKHRCWVPAAEKCVAVDVSAYPSACPRCGSRAYVGGGPADVECTGQDCKFSIHKPLDKRSSLL